MLSLRPNGRPAESVAVACPLMAIESAQAADNMAWKRTVWWISRLTSGIDAPDDLPSRLAAPAGGPGRRAGELRRRPGTAGAPDSAADQVERDVVLGLAQRDHRGATADIPISAGSSGDRRVELLRSLGIAALLGPWAAHLVCGSSSFHYSAAAHLTGTPPRERPANATGPSHPAPRR